MYQEKILKRMKCMYMPNVKPMQTKQILNPKSMYKTDQDPSTVGVYNQEVFLVTVTGKSNSLHCNTEPGRLILSVG